MCDPLALAPTVGGPFYGTVRVDAPATGPKAVAAHRESCRAQGNALGVDLKRRAGGGRMVPPPGIEGNDGREGFGLYKVRDALGIQPAVVDDGPHGDRQGMCRTGLEEAGQTGRPHREVGVVGGSEPDMDGEGMVGGDDPVLEVAMAEKIGVAVRIIPPGRRGIPVETVMVTAQEAVGATVAGGPPVGTGTRGPRGPVAAEDEGLEIAQEAPLDCGENTTGDEEVFQAREQLLGPGLGGSREQLLGEACGDGIGLRRSAGLRGVPIGLFLLAVAPMPALTLAAGTDVVGTRRGRGTIFEAVDKRVERPDRRRLEGGKASDLGKARMGAQVVSPLGETFVVEEQHKQEGPEHTDRVVGRPTAGAWSIERAEQGPGGVQSEPEEHEGGLMPRLGEPTGRATEPAVERGGQHGTILGMGWVHGMSALGRRGDT
jgi:hypothetical protein